HLKKSGEEVMIFSPEIIIPNTLKGVSMPTCA
ncbi:DNA adenine methylase, partial [Escherichia coli]|nr:DNA adenine methylase [Escherichia coli]